MADNIEDAIMPILQKIQGDIAEIKASVRSVKAEMRREFTSVKAELGTIQTHMAGFHGSFAHHRSELAVLDERLRRVEQRLGLDESEH